MRALRAECALEAGEIKRFHMGQPKRYYTLSRRVNEEVRRAHAEAAALDTNRRAPYTLPFA